uniref:Acyl carrier protein n=1 Tax=Candidatus Kentrum eta TaxID=2126337 RepID=A0A450UFC3_9GAMM|nr:MAG: acyl carrier protein [Candidatus Kentron sp. H]VFJ92349.1 MAG: acyl carrier protein [Candidatus Kentron sp. H]VFJ98927.1 MAG: acyl carrier protein [Candidatus Kentron sp. H]
MIENVTQKLKEIISGELDVNLKPEEIDENVSLFEEGLGLDSVVIMEFISLIEANFGFQLSDDELNMESFKDLRTLASLISDKQMGYS